MGVLHRYRRFAAMLALAGVALYTALAPTHIVSQAMANPDATAGFPVDCHSDMAQADPGAPLDQGAPATPEKKCPFCKGYASFMSALAGAQDAGAIDAQRPSVSLPSADVRLVRAEAKTPQNRGPPIQL